MGVAAVNGRRAVFLDRDGVLNRALTDSEGRVRPPSSAAQLEILDGTPEATALLRRAGFLVIVVTNQPDVARGTQRRAVVERINDAVARAVGVDEMLVCYHDDGDDCRCRKPRPGMLLDAAARWDIHLPSSFMVGDRWRDIDAGKRAGCTTVLVGGAEQAPWSRPDLQFSGLREAAHWICGSARSEPAMGRITDLRLQAQQRQV